jgi:hypothetical protein
MVRPALAFVLDWSRWRRHHQAVARACHHRRRMTQLQLWN